MMFFVNFYERYLFLCNQKKISPTRAAIENNISRAAVNRWKNGSVPYDTAIQRLAEYFEVSFEYLKGTEQKEKPGAVKATEPMIELWEKYIKLSASDKKTIDDMFDFLLSKPEYQKKDNVG